MNGQMTHADRRPKIMPRYSPSLLVCLSNGEMRKIAQEPCVRFQNVKHVLVLFAANVYLLVIVVVPAFLHWIARMKIQKKTLKISVQNPSRTVRAAVKHETALGRWRTVADE